MRRLEIDPLFILNMTQEIKNKGEGSWGQFICP